MMLKRVLNAAGEYISMLSHLYNICHDPTCIVAVKRSFPHVSMEQVVASIPFCYLDTELQKRNRYVVFFRLSIREIKAMSKYMSNLSVNIP